MKCWGRNSEGQLGDGTSNGRYTPASVSGLASGVAKVAAGQAHTCASATGGGARCWGWNFYGQLGDGTKIGRQTPVEVLGLESGVQDVTAASYHSCALTVAAEGAGGGVKCWGSNSGGQLGDGTTQNSPVRVSVSGLESGAAGIATGGVFSCASTERGRRRRRRR